MQSKIMNSIFESKLNKQTVPSWNMDALCKSKQHQKTSQEIGVGNPGLPRRKQE